MTSWLLDTSEPPPTSREEPPPSISNSSISESIWVKPNPSWTLPVLALPETLTVWLALSPPPKTSKAWKPSSKKPSLSKAALKL